MSTLAAIALFTAWAVAVVAAAWVDAHTCRLPNRIVLSGIAVTLILATTAGRLPGAAIGALLLGVPFLGIHLARPHGFGFGDVKYGALIGAGLGCISAPLPVVAYAMATIAQLMVVAIRPWPAQRRAGTPADGAPFGPSLALGAAVAASLPFILHAYGS